MFESTGLKIKKKKNKILHVIFYYFTKTSTLPTHQFTKSQREDIYNNFRILCCINVNKRKVQSDVTNNNLSDSEDNKNLLKNSTKKMFLNMNNFNSTEARQIFYCQTEDNNIED